MKFQAIKQRLLYRKQTICS